MDQSVGEAHASFLQRAKSSPLKEQLEANQANYQVQLQVVKYFKFTEWYEKHRCFTVATEPDDQLQVIFVYGHLMPEKSSKQDFESMKMDFIGTMQSRADKFFTLVFFNTGLMTGSALADFKEFYSSLPVIFFKNLQEIIVLHANFIVKSGGMFTSNEYFKFFKKLTVFVDNLLMMSKQKWFKYRYLRVLHNGIKQYDNSHKDIEQVVKKSMLLKKKTMQELEDGQLEDDNEDFDKDSKILGQPLESYPRNRNDIPWILNYLVQYFDQKPAAMKVEGLFRKQAAVYEEKILEAALACEKISFVQSVENAHVVAGVFKQFFLKLPDPLMPYSIYDYVIKNVSQQNFEQEKDNVIRTIYSQMPAFNYAVLIFVLSFILKIVGFKDLNLMTTYNMGVVFGPNFFRSKVLSMADFQHVNTFVLIVQAMLDTFKTYFEAYNYQDYLEQKEERFDSSMVPFLPDDAANIEEIEDMIGAHNASIVITEVEREQLRNRKKRIFQPE